MSKLKKTKRPVVKEGKAENCKLNIRKNASATLNV
jgi:hypothetical protein